jgi:hypothetical protein
MKRNIGDGGKGRGDRKKADGHRGPKWKPLEYQCLCDSWKAVSVNPTGTNQTSVIYWKRIKTEFDERKIADVEYRVMHMKRSQKYMQSRWGIIQHAINNFTSMPRTSAQVRIVAQTTNSNLIMH